MKDNLDYQLKSRANGKQWHERNKARRNAEARVQYRDVAETAPERHMLYRMKAVAARKGLPFDLREEDIVVPPVCPVLGIPLQFARGKKGAAQNSPSLDRIVPSLGYVRGNVRVMSYRANTLRNNATVEELEAVLAFMRREG